MTQEEKPEGRLEDKALEMLGERTSLQDELTQISSQIELSIQAGIQSRIDKIEGQIKELNSSNSNSYEERKLKQAMESCVKGLYEAKQGRNEEAIGNYKFAALISSDYAEAHCLLGSTFFGMGMSSAFPANARRSFLEEAEYNLEIAIRIDPKNEEPYNTMGHTLMILDDTEGAISYCKKAIRINPGNPSNYGLLGTLLRKKGENEEADNAFKTATDLINKANQDKGRKK